MRRKSLLVALLVLFLAALAGLAAWMGERPSVRAAPVLSVPIAVHCGPCPNAIGEWVKVSEYLAWSGCQDWDCWSQWIANDPSNALMEDVGDRFPRSPGQSNPPGWPNPGSRGQTVPCTNCSIWDGRELCGDGEAAGGTWYHNAFARPNWSYIHDPVEGLSLYCSWQMDLSKQLWNFAEDDRCEQQVCLEPTPPVTVTQCYVVETPIVQPTQAPPTPTPFAALPPDLQAKAFIHSRHDPNDGVYPTAPRFYWNWQEFLDASLTAEVTEPTVPGCAASSEVVSYWFYGSVGQTVCPEDGSDPDCRWRPVYKGGAHPDVTRPEWIHLVWSRTATPSERPATWGFFPVGPVTVDISYGALVMTTYTCDGGANTYVAFWAKDLALQVGLLRTVRRY